MKNANQPSPVIAAAPARLLIIDDEPGLTQLLSRILRNHHTVTTEVDGRRAIARIAAGETFDLILCDLLMQPVGGLEVLDAVTRLAPELTPRFVLMSGGAPTQELETVITGWRHGVLRKPFQVHEVLGLVTTCLERLQSEPPLIQAAAR